MAKNDSKDVASAPKFEAYSWAQPETEGVKIDSSVLINFAEKVQAITYGAKFALSLAEMHEIETACDSGETYFTVGEIANLSRLAQFSLDMLAGEAERLKEWLYDYHTPEGRAQAYESAAYSLKQHREPLPVID